MYDDTEYFKNRRIERAKKLKQDYFDTECSKDNNAYTFQQIEALMNMAKYDVWPDGRFGDVDCEVWALFHHLYEDLRKAQA